MNSPANLLNPATTGYLDLYVTQNLLQGFGVGVNNRNIRVAKNNTQGDRPATPAAGDHHRLRGSNLYWDMVSFNEDVRIKEQALATAEKLLEDNKKQVRTGRAARH